MGSFGEINYRSRFCEHTLGLRLGPYPTEMANALSSLVMSFYGLLGLFYYNHRQSHLIQFMWATLTCCGFGSFLYHLTFLWGFALADGFPMIILSTMGLLIILWDFSYEHEESGHVIVKNYRVSSGLSLVLVFYLITTLIVSATNVNYTAYLVLFVAPLVPILCFMLFYLIHDRDIPYVQNLLESSKWNQLRELENRTQAKRIIRNSIIAGLSGLVLWLMDQLLCVSFPPIVYLFGHAWWHILIGYFAMSMTAFVSLLYCNNRNCYAEIGYVWWLFPLTKFGDPTTV